MRTLPVRTGLLTGFLTLAMVSATVATAIAHPHVYVTMVSELIYAPDGTVTAIKHAWTFDDMFSAYTIKGIDEKTSGEFTREELAPLAKSNIDALKDFDYFTIAKVSGEVVAFADAAPDYRAEFKDQLFTLHFTLPFKTPVKARELAIEVYDPSYFIDFAFAEKDPVKAVGAPEQCKVSTSRPGGAPANSEVPADPDNWGALYASKILVTCP
jgi:ABC-type uncharacterized transport system substrate-binding protein